MWRQAALKHERLWAAGAAEEVQWWWRPANMRKFCQSVQRSEHHAPAALCVWLINSTARDAAAHWTATERKPGFLMLRSNLLPVLHLLIQVLQRLWSPVRFYIRVHARDLKNSRLNYGAWIWICVIWSFLKLLNLVCSPFPSQELSGDTEPSPAWCSTMSEIIGWRFRIHGCRLPALRAAEAPSVLWLQTIEKRRSALRLFKSSEMFLTPAAG